MDNPFLKLTVTDRQILNSYALMLNGLGAYLGDGYELVLHSLESLDHSVIKIINGHFTGRKEGSPITDLALKMLGELEQDPSRTVSPYFNKSSSDSMLRSCTIPITGEHGRIIGLLCINFHMEMPLSEFLQGMLPSQDSSSVTQASSETFSDNIDDLILFSLTETKESVYNDPGISSSNKNKEIIFRLYQQGIFNLKDAVIKVANQLNISKILSICTFEISKFHLHPIRKNPNRIFLIVHTIICFFTKESHKFFLSSTIVSQNKCQNPA